MSEEPQPLEWTDELVARFWAYQSRFPENYFSHKCGRSVAAYLKRHISTGAEVLDYGCGPGHFIPHLLEAGYKVTGADVDVTTIGKAVDVSAELDFRGFRSIQNLIEEGCTFDAIVLLEVVEHLDDKWLEATLSNVFALLRSDGFVLITTPNEENLNDSIVFCPASNTTFHRWQHVRSWSQKSLRETLTSYGFIEVSTQTLNFSEKRPHQTSFARWFVSSLLSYFRKPRSLVGIGRVRKLTDSRSA